MWHLDQVLVTGFFVMGVAVLDIFVLANFLSIDIMALILFLQVANLVWHIMTIDLVFLVVFSCSYFPVMSFTPRSCVSTSMMTVISVMMTRK
jgi:hypothetical protein